MIVEGPTWKEAEANAQKLGGHLVTINDAAENKWIHETFNLNPWWDRSSDVELFGGLYRDDVNSPWTWASGEEVTFTNWSSGEPSNGPEELYLGLGWSDHYAWNDTYNDAGRNRSEIGSWPYPVTYKGIAEIRLDAEFPVGVGTPATAGLTVIAINDAPELSGAVVVLPDGTEDVAYTIYNSDLLQGYSDVDGDNASGRRAQSITRN